MAFEYRKIFGIINRQAGMHLGAAGAIGTGKWCSGSSIGAVLSFPLQVVDRAVSVGYVLVASQALTVFSDVMNDVLFTVRHTATAATDVAQEAGTAFKYSAVFQTITRMAQTMTQATNVIGPYFYLQ